MAASSASIPGPLSVTVNPTEPEPLCVVTSMLPPGGVYFRALAIRLVITCMIRERSDQIGGVSASR